MTKPEDIKKFITEQVFIDPTDFQKPSLEECLRAAENRKDPFRSAIWAIASRSTINDRIERFCTQALNALGNKTMLQDMVEEQMTRGTFSSKNPIYVDFAGFGGTGSRGGTGSGSRGLHDQSGELAGTHATFRGQNTNTTHHGSNLGSNTNANTYTNNNNNHGSTNFIQPSGHPSNHQHDLPAAGTPTAGFAANTTNTHTTTNTVTSLNPSSRTVSVNSEEERPTSTKDSPRGGRKRRTNNPWSRDEEYHLKKGIVKFGPGSWAKIHREYHLALSGRTQIDLKDKWRNMCRNRTQQEIDEILMDVREDGSDPNLLPTINMEGLDDLQWP